MKMSTRLKGPTALGLQGFVAGALIFFTVHPLAPKPEAPPAESGAIEMTRPA